MRDVHLVWSETLHGALAGVLRNMNAIYNGLPERYGCDGRDNWTGHIEGACAELAFGKLLGRYWNLDVTTFSGGDDVDGFQVRSTPRADGRLIIHPRDRDDALFALVTGAVPDFRVHGVIRARDAKREEWLFAPNGRAAYFAPSESLEPIEVYL